MALYNIAVYMPETVKRLAPPVFDNLTYGRHAIRESKEDRYGAILSLPRHVSAKGLVEVDTFENKFIVRHSLDQQRDLVLVIIPKNFGRGWFVKTTWINLKSDAHKTLNRKNYVQAP